MPSRPHMSSRPVTQAAEPDPNYDPYAIFDPNGPIHPGFMREAVRTLMRALPLDPDEPPALTVRRMHAALHSLAALHPRDAIEVMLAVQALSAYHMAAANWWLAMNHHQPNGDSGRHASVAASAARTFDTMLKVLERRQARPLTPPPGRPPGRVWPKEDPAAVMADWTERCREEDADATGQGDVSVAWSQADIALADAMRRRGQDGPADAPVEGALPDGGIIMPETTTREQDRYIASRLSLEYQQEMRANRQKGVDRMPPIRPLRIGDHVR